MRLEVERQLRAARRRLVNQARNQGQHAVCWGYLVRKTLQTAKGDLGPIRIPRLRIDDQEVRLLPRYLRRVQAFDDLVAETTLSGLSQRRISPWLHRNTGQSLSAWTVGRIESARAMVYPDAAFQLCLWHWWRGLKARVPRRHQREFNRDFWEVYDGLDEDEVRQRAASFRTNWRRRCPDTITAFGDEFERTVSFVRLPTVRVRHRVRTVNLAESFFRHFRRFFNRFPGFQDEAHLCRVLGLYLLSAEPDLWRTNNYRRVLRRVS